jgi:hypothetical protein
MLRAVPLRRGDACVQNAEAMTHIDTCGHLDNCLAALTDCLAHWNLAQTANWQATSGSMWKLENQDDNDGDPLLRSLNGPRSLLGLQLSLRSRQAPCLLILLLLRVPRSRRMGPQRSVMHQRLQLAVQTRRMRAVMCQRTGAMQRWQLLQYKLEALAPVAGTPGAEGRVREPRLWQSLETLQLPLTHPLWQPKALQQSARSLQGPERAHHCLKLRSFLPKAIWMMQLATCQ